MALEKEAGFIPIEIIVHPFIPAYRKQVRSTRSHPEERATKDLGAARKNKILHAVRDDRLLDRIRFHSLYAVMRLKIELVLDYITHPHESMKKPGAIRPGLYKIMFEPEILTACRMNKNQAYEDYPFGPGPVCIKVAQ